MVESDIQRAVFAEIRSRGMPGLVAWHCPNDRSSTRKAGFVRGAHDVHMLHKGTFYTLELKVERGKVEVEQLLFRDRINDAGGFSFISYGLPQAINALEGWGLIRRAA
jgi:hypothetical protein